MRHRAIKFAAEIAGAPLGGYALRCLVAGDVGKTESARWRVVTEAEKWRGGSDRSRSCAARINRRLLLSASAGNRKSPRPALFFSCAAGESAYQGWLVHQGVESWPGDNFHITWRNRHGRERKSIMCALRQGCRRRGRRVSRRGSLLLCAASISRHEREIRGDNLVNRPKCTRVMRINFSASIKVVVRIALRPGGNQSSSSET